MSYAQAATARIVAGRTAKRGKAPQTPETPEKMHFPFFLAIIIMVSFYMLTHDPLPSIAIPLVLWLIVKYKG